MWMLLALVVLCLIAALAFGPARAADMAVMSHEGITITLTDEPCALKAVSNTPYRAIWREAGKSFEGCYTIQGGAVVVAYFDDRSIVALPLARFGRPL